MTKKIIFFLTIFLILFSCTEDDNNQSKELLKETIAKEVKIPRFDRDSAFAYVKKQTEFGPRVPNTEAHRQTKAWLVSEFKRFEAEVIEQSFDAEAYTGEILKATNIIAQYNPEHSKRIVLAAHWDSRHIADHDPSVENREEYVMGADDGGSGVGVLLEIARQIQANPIDLGVDIVLFDVEDHGDGSDDADLTTWCLGSQYWSRNLHRPDYEAKYGILLDMVGAKGARFLQDQVSLTYAPKVVKKVWGLAASMGYGNFFVAQRGPGITDDHLFVNRIAKIPMIDIINLPKDGSPPFVNHWHTIEDTIDKIDPRTLRAVGQVVLATIYKESGGQL
ncbi:MAG: M28 family peptidase [Bacteroidota bacterium]